MLVQGQLVEMKSFQGNGLFLLRVRVAALYAYGLVAVWRCPIVVFSAEAPGITFSPAAERIVSEVALGSFGAMTVAITGILAIVAAVTGSYKGAWAVLYVSIGLFILKELVRLLFPGSLAA